MAGDLALINSQSRVSESNGLISSNWPFYSRLDLLIGSAATAKKSSSSSPPIAVGVGGEMDSMKRLARAIERYGEIYERVEGEKQKQMVELEKQRMQFTKDLEVQRMQLFMDTLAKLSFKKQF